MRYAELQSTSNFSFLRGGSHPDELVVQSAALGHAAVAITDENTVAGVVRAHVAAKELNHRLVIGARLTPIDGPGILIYPTDRAAYGRLARLITLGRCRAEKGQCTLALADVLAASQGQIAVVIPPHTCDDVFLAALHRVRDSFHRSVYLATTCSFGANDASRRRAIAGIAHDARLPLVATNDVHYHVPERRMLQDVLTCIRHGCSIAEAGFRLFANAERHLKTPDEMARLFRDTPEAIENTLEIAERCRFNLDELRYEYPVEIAPPGLAPMDYLTQLSWQGAKERFPDGLPPAIRLQIEHELRLIEELRYEAFFLTVHDVVSFARSRGILCQGRGSAANSIVCYCLGVTAVDPAKIGLLFERFISRERNEPPDIDVDFEHERREEVIQYIYGKYGRERAGLTAVVTTYRTRSAVRDVGKALGFSLDTVDRLAKACDRWDSDVLNKGQIERSGLQNADQLTPLHAQLANELLGFPRHLSQHVGGFVMTNGPLCELVPIQNAAMPERTVIEWNKDDIDALGILKVDVLGLGMLTCIRKSFELVNQHHGRPLTLATVPTDDPGVYDMCCRADTIGVFQIESRGQMSMLPRLKPRNFYDMVIEVAILRPGPIQGDMVHPFLRRRNGLEPEEYPNEAVKAVLEKTLGVPLFQEQVMQLAIVAAGFSGGEADRLRRAVSSFRGGSELEPFYKRFIAGMVANGYDAAFGERLFNQIRGFGSYGFPESHAASFALLAYVSAWLKRYYPAAFAAALLNSHPMGFYAPAQIVRDARDHGVTVLPVDVNQSGWNCTLEPNANGLSPINNGAEQPPSEWGRDGPALRLGMRMVKGLSESKVRDLIAARKQARFHSVVDLAGRGKVARRVLERLARADAFSGMELNRRESLWQILATDRQRVEPTLFDALEPDEQAVALPAMPIGQRVSQDYEMVGLSLEAHPVSLAREFLRRKGRIEAATLRDIPTGRWIRIAGLVTCRQRPETASGVLFVTLEDETGMANVIVRPNIFEKYRGPILRAGLLDIAGRVERNGDVIHVLAYKAGDFSELMPQVRNQSHDFH